MCKIILQKVPDNTECFITFEVTIYVILRLALQYFTINELYKCSPSACNVLSILWLGPPMATVCGEIYFTQHIAQSIVTSSPRCKNEWGKEELSVTFAIVIVTTLCVCTIAMTSQYLAKVSAGHVQPFMRIRHVRSSADDDHEYYQNRWAHRYFIVNSITCGKLHHSWCMHYYRNWPRYGLRWSGLCCHSRHSTSGPAVARPLAAAPAGPRVLCREWQHKPRQRRPYEWSISILPRKRIKTQR